MLYLTVFRCFTSLSMESELSIQAVSRRSGVASSALRYYEERGLIASRRARSGHRRYPRAAPRRIAFIVYAQRIGLSLEEIGAELEKLPADSTPTRGLVPYLRRLDQADRPEDLRASTPKSGTNPMHRMRVSLDRQMRICEPG
jgi:DNA-binding transcriptional MerR regulator